MRTTVDLDPVVLQAAKAIAAQRSISLGRALSELALLGLTAGKAKSRARTGLPVLHAPQGAKPITLDDVKAALDDDA